MYCAEQVEPTNTFSSYSTYLKISRSIFTLPAVTNHVVSIAFVYVDTKFPAAIRFVTFVTNASVRAYEIFASSIFAN